MTLRGTHTYPRLIHHIDPHTISKELQCHTYNSCISMSLCSTSITFILKIAEFKRVMSDVYIIYHNLMKSIVNSTIIKKWHALVVCPLPISSAVCFRYVSLSANDAHRIVSPITVVSFRVIHYLFTAVLFPSSIDSLSAFVDQPSCVLTHDRVAPSSSLEISGQRPISLWMQLQRHK